MRGKPTIHPSSQKLQRAAAEKFWFWRKHADRTRDHIWAGILAAQFSEVEIELVRSLGFLSGHDEAILRAVGKGTDDSRFPDGHEARSRKKK